MLVVALALSVLVGVALGAFGGGGSILTVPILRYALGMEAHSAIAVSLLVVGTTSLAAVVPHARKKRVEWRIGVVFGLAGMAGAYVAGRFAHLIPEAVLLVAFGLMMFATALAMLRGRRSRDVERTDKRMPILAIVLEGLVVGAVTGLVGAGGGFLVVPALVLLGRLPMNVAVGTSLVVIAMKSFAGFAGYLGHTEIDWTVGLLVGAAAVLGSFGGAWLAERTSPDRLRIGFAWFVVAMAFFILAQEIPRAIGWDHGIGWAMAASAGGTAVTAAIAWLLRRGRPRSNAFRDAPSSG